MAEFDRFAEEYEALHRVSIAVTGETPDFFAHYKIAELRSYAAELVKPVRSILDFGSGIGNSVPFFRRHFPQASLTCAEISPRSIALSRKRFPGAEMYTLLEGREIPHGSNTFDVAFSACVFHHIPDHEHTHWLQELLRVTRPGGLVAIFEHNPTNPLTARAVNTCPFDANARLVRPGALARSLESAGWRHIAVRYHVFFPRVLARLRRIEKYIRWLPLGAQYSVSARK